MPYILSNVDTLGALTRITFADSASHFAQELYFKTFLETAAKIANDSGPVTNSTWRIVIQGDFKQGNCPRQYPEVFDEQRHGYAEELIRHCEALYNTSPPLIISHERTGRKVVDLGAVYTTIAALIAYRPEGILDPHKSALEIANDIYREPPK